MRPIIAKLLAAPVLIGAACVLAGLFGALHNQVSYTVGPTYFTEFKFLQFRTPQDSWGRLAVSTIGWRASWWMGLVLGPLLLIPALFDRDLRGIRRLFLTGAGVVFAAAALGSLSGWIYATVTDMEPFSRAGWMHNGAYGGAVAGALIAFGLLCGLVIGGPDCLGGPAGS